MQVKIKMAKCSDLFLKISKQLVSGFIVTYLISINDEAK